MSVSDCEVQACGIKVLLAWSWHVWSCHLQHGSKRLCCQSGRAECYACACCVCSVQAVVLQQPQGNNADVSAWLDKIREQSYINPAASTYNMSLSSTAVCGNVRGYWQQGL